MNYVHWLLEGLLAGRPGPAQRPWDPGELHAAGLRVVVSLNTEPDPLEIAAAGLRHYSLPLPAILPVTGALQNTMLAGIEPVLKTIHDKVQASQPTLVHCHAGKDRTGLVLTAYLVRFLGMEIDESIARVRAVQPIAMSAPGYEATARRFAQREQAEGRFDE
jgi:hypothetical protein